MAETAQVDDPRAFFDANGYLLVKGFAAQEECQGMLDRMQELITAWDPTAEKVPVFVTDEGQENAQASSDYFLDSADRVHFFLEAGAADEDGRLLPDVQKSRALNKAGHGLHVQDEVFRRYSHSAKVAQLVESLGWKDPCCPQSMYIFKQPRLGGEVTSHQDSTFLHTTPRETCLGLWLSLHHATTDNGCVWARPGSHTEPVRRLFVRNPVHFEGDASAPQMIFTPNEAAKDLEAWQWEGQLPAPTTDGLRRAGFVPVECEPGDLLVIHGQVDHLSLPNTSAKERETFQLHIVEGPAEGITWAPSNWLQYKNDKPFTSLTERGCAAALDDSRL